MKQRKTYTTEDPVVNTVNESYNYPAKYDPSNSIETKQNEAYAMNITTEKNEAYKPVVENVTNTIIFSTNIQECYNTIAITTSDIHTHIALHKNLVRIAIHNQ